MVPDLDKLLMLKRQKGIASEVQKLTGSLRRKDEKPDEIKGAGEIGKVGRGEELEATEHTELRRRIEKLAQKVLKGVDLGRRGLRDGGVDDCA